MMGQAKHSGAATEGRDTKKVPVERIGSTKARGKGELESLKKSQQVVSEAGSSCAREEKDELGATVDFMGQ